MWESETYILIEQTVLFQIGYNIMQKTFTGKKTFRIKYVYSVQRLEVGLSVDNGLFLRKIALEDAFILKSPRSNIMQGHRYRSIARLIDIVAPIP